LTSANSAAVSAASAAAAVAASFDAKGDLLVGTGAQAFDQLTVAATNGYILSVNSATTTGLEWVAANPGDITEVVAGTGLTGGGTSGAVTVSLDTTSVYVVPSQSGQSGKYLTTDGSTASWGTVTTYSAPTIGTTLITSGTTVSTITAVTLENATLSGTLTASASSGTNGQYLKTTGTGVEWGTVDALPSQTGNSGKYLTTNGTSASWSTIVTDPTPSVFMLMGA
jgi:hypothetical protein